MDKKLIIMIAVGILLVAIIIALVTNSTKKSNRLKQLDELQDRISTLKALPVQYLLNKVSLMPKTPEVEEQYNRWSESYNRLSNEESNKIKNELIDIEQQVYSRKYNQASEKIRDLESNIKAYETEYEAILNELTQATQIDVKNREEITNQKELFRNYKKMYQSNIDNYKPYNIAIERYFVNIEDSFTNIDILLNQSQVDKARNKAATLEGELLKMKDILNNLPVVLEDLSKDLPKKYELVEKHYNDVVKQKYNVAHLDIAKRILMIRTELLKVLENNNDVFLKDLQDTSHSLHKELDLIDSQLNEEVQANLILKDKIDKLVETELEASKKMDKAINELKEIKEQYILTKNEVANLDMEANLLKDFISEKNEIVSLQVKNNFIASDLVTKAADLYPKFTAIIIAVDAYINHIDKLRTDEKRQYDEYNNMHYIINDCEAKLREMNLPKLSHAYYDTIEQCKKGLIDILAMLGQKPLDINKINSKVSAQHEIVYKLYDNSRNLLKTAQMAENTIVFGNRYRSSRPEIDSMLGRAEIFFNNGEYTKSLTTAIESIETIYPRIRQELLSYKKEQLESTPI
ncbi:septation ring formation regulator EzrA [Mycoplasma sp. P36-A1]|uniref:septation ring formation regulator EzrA n=1 Tax=Mycoplasma sp. P36-A1 TaxID=3252900 RepID=UPI003C2B5E08